MLVHPARMTEIPRLQMGVLEAPLGELLHHPVGGGFIVRRPGEARSVTVRQHVHGVHHLRMLHGFLANARIHALVHRFFREHQAGGREQRERLLHDSNRIAHSRTALKRGQRLPVFPRHSYMGGQTGARVLVCLLLCDTLLRRTPTRPGMPWNGPWRYAAAWRKCPTRSSAFMALPPWPAWSARSIRSRRRASSATPSRRCSISGPALSANAATTVLPVASFSGLWKYVVPAALKCDPTLSSTAQNQQASERMNAERTGANSTLGRAYGMLSPELVLDKADMLDRAAQVARWSARSRRPRHARHRPPQPLTLPFVRKRAPDLSDDLFIRSVDFVMSANVPSPRIACKTSPGSSLPRRTFSMSPRKISPTRAFR